MSWHGQDVAGCENIMQTIMEYPNNIVSYTHTVDEFNEFDMIWNCSTSTGEIVQYRVEGKERDLNMDDFKTAYIRENKFRSMAAEKVMVPVIVCGYHDGVLSWQVNMLPVSDVLRDIDDAKMRFNADAYAGKTIAKLNEWTEWRYVWNPAQGKKRWELNVVLPIYKENKRGFRRLKKHVS